MGFEFLTALTKMNALFWDVTSYSLVDVYFRSCLQYNGSKRR
jgi:hypothetical protein